MTFVTSGMSLASSRQKSKERKETEGRKRDNLRFKSETGTNE